MKHRYSKVSAPNKHAVPAVEQMLDIVEHLADNQRAYNREDDMLGIFCIGAPIFDVNGEPVAGLGVTWLVSVSRPEKQAELGQAVLACAGNLSRDIAYGGGRFAGFQSRLEGGK